MASERTPNGDRKTIRKYLKQGGGDESRVPGRHDRASSTDLKSSLSSAGVRNAVLLLRELTESGYDGGNRILKNYIEPRRQEFGWRAIRAV
jgi:transposase